MLMKSSLLRKEENDPFTHGSLLVTKLENLIIDILEDSYQNQFLKLKRIKGSSQPDSAQLPSAEC